MEHTKGKYWIDADSFLVVGNREKDRWRTVAEIPSKNCQPLSQILNSHNDLLEALRNCIVDAKQTLTKKERFARIKYAEQAIVQAT